MPSYIHHIISYNYTLAPSFAPKTGLRARAGLPPDDPKTTAGQSGAGAVTLWS